MGVEIGTLGLPEFRLETYFARWEFAAEHNLTASDAETMTVAQVLALDRQADLGDVRLGYVPTWGTDGLRTAVASTYETLVPDDVLAFAGAEEAVFWAMQLLAGPGDHVVVSVPNYQSMESVALTTGAEVTGLPLWTGGGDDLRWTLDLDLLASMLRPTTRVVAVNFPNNPSGFVPVPEVFRELVALCEGRGIRLVHDEVYRGLEQDPRRTLPQAADLSDRAVSLNVMSKAYGLPGLRIGWIATHDADLLRRLERAKHYTSICNAAPSEYLATVALRHGAEIRARNRGIVAENQRLFDDFFGEFPNVFTWTPPDGGCVAFPRYRGPGNVEDFCREAVERYGVLLLPASVYQSRLADVPSDRFRIGLGRRRPEPALDRLRELLGAQVLRAGE